MPTIDMQDTNRRAIVGSTQAIFSTPNGFLPAIIVPTRA